MKTWYLATFVYNLKTWAACQYVSY